MAVRVLVHVAVLAAVASVIMPVCSTGDDGTRTPAVQRRDALAAAQRNYILLQHQHHSPETPAKSR